MRCLPRRRTEAIHLLLSFCRATGAGDAAAAAISSKVERTPASMAELNTEQADM